MQDMVDLYQEEAEVFKEKNYHHKERVLHVKRMEVATNINLFIFFPVCTIYN